jgi:hypothetical protein
LIKHARQVVTVCKNGETLLKGTAMNDVCVLNGPVSVVINCDGHIGYIGKDTEVSQKFEEKEFERIVDATDCCVIPGRNIVVLEGSGGGGVFLWVNVIKLPQGDERQYNRDIVPDTDIR